MRKYLLVLGFWVMGAMGVITASAALAEGESVRRVQPQQVITDIPSLNDIEQPLTTAEGLLVQQPAPTPALAQVTGVQLQPTDKGLEVILETTSEFAEVLNSETENSLITDIPNAQLRLPNGGAFRQDNPTQDIASVEVTNLDARTLRVTVTGKAGVPTAEVSQSPQALILSVVAPPAPVAPPAQPTPAPAPAEPQQPAAPEVPAPAPQAEEERLELTVKAEEEAGGYDVPDTSTATKTDTPIRDIPQSIQVVPRQVIEDQKITRISDAARNVSGVSVERGYADNTDYYRIRGFVNYNTLRNGFTLQDPSINPTNIERVEVLKGPASVLYGQFEPGGVVNYVTKKPLSEPFYAAEFTVGNYGFYNPSIDISGPLNTDRTLLYRLNAAYLTSGNFVDFVDQRQFAIAAALTYNISDATTLDFEYEYIDESRTFYDGLLPDPVSFQLPISRFLNDPSNKDYTSSTNNIFLSLNHRFSDNLQLRSSFATRLGTFDSTAARPGSLLEDGRSISRGYQIDDNVEIQFYSLQTDLIGKFDTGSIQHQVLLGLDLSRDRYADDYYYDPDNLTVPPLDLFNPVYGGFPIPDRSQLTFDPFNNKSNIIGIYLQDQIALLPNLKLLLGGRFDFIHRNNTGLDTESRFYDEAFSPRVGIVYQPVEPISLYASYSRGFNPTTNRTADGALFPPERGTQYEVGIKTDLNNRLSATLAAYEITKTNVATVDPDDTEFSIPAGEVKSRGIELDVAGEILPGWNVIASTYLNNAFVSEDNDLPVGDTLVNAPHVGASLWTTYEIQDGDWQGLGFGAGMFFVGDREAQLPNTFEIPSYVRADAAIYYKRDNWKVGLNFKNITSTRYYDSQGYFLLPGTPFTVLGTVGVEF